MVTYLMFWLMVPYEVVLHGILILFATLEDRRANTLFYIISFQLVNILK